MPVGDAEQLEVTAVTGATASGKSAVALEVAERIGGEIVSVDSMKVYRRMDIGTAKPSREEAARVPHHLIDIREPWEGYTVHDFVRDAEAAARDIRSRGRAVVMEGGTPLYLKAFLDGMLECPPPDEELRRRLREEARRDGLGALHARLREVDPASAGRIHPNDERRITRALEVYTQTGTPISELQGQFGLRREGVKARLVALRRPREEIRERIALRLERMLASGMLAEARELLRLHTSERRLSRPALGALGYGELWAHLRGELTLAEARERIVRETFRFARKQLAWLRSFPELVWFDASDDPRADAAAMVSALAARSRGPA